MREFRRQLDFESVVAAESIQDSFNVIEKADIEDDLKDQLKQLAATLSV